MPSSPIDGTPSTSSPVNVSGAGSSEPYQNCTLPAGSLRAFSHKGSPMATSAIPSPLKSPIPATPAPNWSPWVAPTRVCFRA